MGASGEKPFVGCALLLAHAKRNSQALGQCRAHGFTFYRAHYVFDEFRESGVLSLAGLQDDQAKALVRAEFRAFDDFIFCQRIAVGLCITFSDAAIEAIACTNV